MLKIGLLGPQDDQEVMAVKTRLENRGIITVDMDFGQYPGHMSVSFKNSNIAINGMDISGLGSAFQRGRGVHLPFYVFFDIDKVKYIKTVRDNWESIHARHIRYVKKEIACQKLRCAVIQALSRNCQIINPMIHNDLHRLKTYTMFRLRKNGLPVPDFIIGTAQHKLKKFISLSAANGYETVIKPLAGIYKTRLWDENSWQRHKWKARGVFYQHFIKGDTIRCYVLDNKVIAAARIVHRGTVDSSQSQTGIQVLNLPDKAIDIALKTANTLDLTFCGMDLMHETKSGKYYVIDCNISPMFVNFARLSRIDIPGLIADYLITAAEKTKNKKIKKFKLLTDIKEIITIDNDIKNFIKSKSEN